MKIVKQSFYVVFVLALVFGLSACNTVRGVGQDVQAGGQAISNAAA